MSSEYTESISELQCCLHGNQNFQNLFYIDNANVETEQMYDLC